MAQRHLNSSMAGLKYINKRFEREDYRRKIPISSQLQTLQNVALKK